MRDGGQDMRGTRRTVVAAAVVAALGLAVLAVVLGVPWLWAGVAAAALVAGGGLVGGGGTTGHRPPTSTGSPTADPLPPSPPARDVDDLPAFFSEPPGSAPRAAVEPPTPAPSPESSGATTAEDPAPEAAPPTGGGRRGAWRVTGTALVVLVAAGLVAAAVGLALDRGPRPVATPAPSATPTSSSTGSSTGPSPGTSDGSAPASTGPAAPLTAGAAGDLADTDVPPGADGFSASLTFAGVVLEPRAVGVTVVYPVLTASGDGTSSVLHLELPVWNCLAGGAPVDPVAAQCTRSLTEYADLGSPDLVARRTEDGAALSGTVATYTRPNGSAPVYTGRSYPVVVEVAESPAGATGSLELGGNRVGALAGGTVRG